MSGSWLAVLALLAGVALGDDTPADDELQQALDEVAAAGALVDPEVLSFWDASEAQVRWSLRGRDDGPTVHDLRLAAEGHGVRLGARWRRQTAGDEGAGWLEWATGRQRLGAGAGGFHHGAGLVSAAPGARARLDAGSSLRPATAGWRSSTSVTSERVTAVWAALRAASVGLHAAAGRDEEGRPMQLAMVGVGETNRLSALWVQRADGQGLSLAASSRRGDWRLDSEVARWHGSNRALTATVTGRPRGWVLEAQGAVADAAEPMPGALRPASLLGWRGRGWSLRAVGRPWPEVRAGLLLAGAICREPEPARGDLRTRHRCELTVSGTGWRLRWRHDEEQIWAWQDEAPWLPPAAGSRRPVTWLAVTVRRPVAHGEALLDWRRRQELEGARQLLALGWRRELGAVRFQARCQAAWGQPLDLVTLSVPVYGYFLVQHWGHWDAGAWFAVEGRGRWRWQLAVAQRRQRRGLGDLVVRQGYLGFQRRF